MAKNEDNNTQPPAETQQTNETKAPAAKLYVLTTAFQYIRKDPKDRTQIIESRIAHQGEEVDVDPQDRDRLVRIGAIGDEAALRRVTLGAEEGGAPAAVTVEQIEAMSPLEVIGYLSQNSEDAEIDRVEAIEKSREGGSRHEVEKAVQTIRDFKNL